MSDMPTIAEVMSRDEKKNWMFLDWIFSEWYEKLIISVSFMFSIFSLLKFLWSFV